MRCINVHVHTPFRETYRVGSNPVEVRTRPRYRVSNKYYNSRLKFGTYFSKLDTKQLHVSDSFLTEKCNVPNVVHSDPPIMIQRLTQKAFHGPQSADTVAHATSTHKTYTFVQNFQIKTVEISCFLQMQAVYFIIPTCDSLSRATELLIYKLTIYARTCRLYCTTKQSQAVLPTSMVAIPCKSTLPS